MMQNNLGLEAIGITFFWEIRENVLPLLLFFVYFLRLLVLCNAVTVVISLTGLTLESIEWLCCRPTDPIIRDGEDSSTSGAEPTTTSTTTTAEPVRQNGKNFIACRSMTGGFWLTLKILTYLRHTILNVALFRSHVYYILTSVTI